MNWIALSLLSATIFSLSVLVDKYIVERLQKQFWGLPVASALIGLVFGFIFLFIAGTNFPPLLDSIIILLTGMFTLWGAVLYFKAMSEESSSIVVILFQLQPVFVLVLSWAILQEVIRSVQLVGFAIILASALILSIQREETNPKSFRLSAAFWWVLGADLFWALGSVLFKLVVTESNIWMGAALEAWGIFFGGVIAAALAPSLRLQFVEILRGNRAVLPYIAFNETLFTAGKFVLLYAILLGPVALVTVLGSTSVLFTMVAERSLAVFLPAVYRVRADARSFMARTGLVLAMLAGIWLLQA
ncbi:MAG: EamA family transporter [Anaerolineae bacterium]|nr:MAG: EamA family transporter [Anaerolineae bacterium]